MKSRTQPIPSLPPSRHARHSISSQFPRTLSFPRTHRISSSLFSPFLSNSPSFVRAECREARRSTSIRLLCRCWWIVDFWLCSRFLFVRKAREMHLRRLLHPPVNFFPPYRCALQLFRLYERNSDCDPLRKCDQKEAKRQNRFLNDCACNARFEGISRESQCSSRVE